MAWRNLCFKYVITLAVACFWSTRITVYFVSQTFFFFNVAKHF